MPPTSGADKKGMYGRNASLSRVEVKAFTRVNVDEESLERGSLANFWHGCVFEVILCGAFMLILCQGFILYAQRVSV